MRQGVLFGVLLAVAVAVAAPARSAEDAWAGYLDYAYVYASAESEALRARLAEYGREAGMSLDRYITERFEAVPRTDGPLDEARVRREAVAHLLDYLSSGEPDALGRSVEVVRELEGRLGRHENRYWYHYVLAHRALEKGRRFDFVGELLDLWREVVVPLEGPYETLQTLSLGDAPNAGFAAALPFVYENVARLILIRSQQMGIDRDLDPLGAIVRLLHDGRVGGQPEVVPLAASSRDYLDRIVARLDGPESDAGSLTFTLALFEASKYHDEARSLLASEGLGDRTQGAIRVAAGAYESALDRAETVQGECAVQTRVLRQIGEVYAAKQRLGVDPEIETPFQIEDALEVYAKLHRGLEGGWQELGYARNGRPDYVAAMRGLWSEIQEASLNAADYYLARSVESPHRADEDARNAARLYSRYLSFFRIFATADGKEGVPESAYFAAHEAARGLGDAFLLYAEHPTPTEIDLSIRSYRTALRIFPFDRRLWSGLAAALERQGRESEYSSLVRPAAEAVTSSRSVDTWIEKREPAADRIAVLRRAFGDSLALVYLGFAEASGIEELERSLEELHAEREEVSARLVALRGPDPDGDFVPASTEAALPAAPAPDAAELAERNRAVAETSALLERLDKQIEARTRTLPLYKATLATDGLAAELRSQRDHPVHSLLRRMYFESRARPEESRK
jgi:hypothetical protein